VSEVSGSSEPFALGTYRRGDGLPFPALVMNNLAYRLDLPSDITGAGWPSLLAVFDAFDLALPLLQRLAARLTAAADTPGLPLDELTVLAPLEPRQIICAGANYRKHVVDILVDQRLIPGGGSDAEKRRAAERLMDHRASRGQPYAFLKPVTSVIGPFENLVLPADSQQVDWELELVVVMGKDAYRVPRQQALDHVAGFTIGNDISARDRIKRPDFPSLGMDWLACKGAPGFLPLGPHIVPRPFIQDPQRLDIELRLNGDVMQSESTADMLFSVATLIEFITTHMRLRPGDLICTGSPSGNGTHHNRFLEEGDVLEGAISGLGAQRATCVREVLAEGAARHLPFTPPAAS
jgi:2-keto-4-pentenoate hydratase/2-oxohepta-3-ene-1,7-dioic acid hydratase in catechol pathway